MKLSSTACRRSLLSPAHTKTANSACLVVEVWALSLPQNSLGSSACKSSCAGVASCRLPSRCSPCQLSSCSSSCCAKRASHRSTSRCRLHASATTCSCGVSSACCCTSSRYRNCTRLCRQGPSGTHDSRTCTAAISKQVSSSTRLNTSVQPAGQASAGNALHVAGDEGGTAMVGAAVAAAALVLTCSTSAGMGWPCSTGSLHCSTSL